MKGVYLSVYFVYTFVYTFLREVKQMYTFKVYTLFSIKKKDTYDSIHTRLHRLWPGCIPPQSTHLLHQQIISIHETIHKVYTKSYIFGG